MMYLAEAPPGSHPLTPVCGTGNEYLNLIVVKFFYCAFTVDTLASSALAVLVTLAVCFWVAGFDIIYACQDADFDRRARLASVPARLGVPAALRVVMLVVGLLPRRLMRSL